MTRWSPRMVCSGCGAAADVEERYPFRCPNAEGGDDTDHVLQRVLPDGVTRFPSGVESNPFARYRELSFSYHYARSRGLSDADYLAVVAELDAAVAGVAGRGFCETPFAPGPDAFPGLWIKDETGNVSGSHKARHLMGVAIYLRVLERVHPELTAATRTLAIASCGNAALAAAVVARAAGESLEVFVPPDAEPGVIAELRRLGAGLTTCAREPGERGDPCYLRFREVVNRGALPFCCQGSDNGLTLDGGRTLGYEIVTRALERGDAFDALVVQVGGGALASSCIQALQEAHALGALPRLPRVDTVQTRGAAPLERAYERLAGRIAARLDLATGDRRERAAAIRAHADSEVLMEELRHAATHRSEFMWPWEHEPRSIARSILDDETYDWLAVVAGMLRTGGLPLVAGEEELREAHRLARATTDIPVSVTGSAGLAGLLCLAGEGELPREDRIVLFTGRVR